MRLYTVNFNAGVLILLMHDQDNEQTASLNMYNDARHRYDCERDVLQGYLNGYLERLPDFCSNNIPDIVKAFGDLRVCVVSNMYMLLFAEGIHSIVAQASIWDLLKQIGSVDSRALFVYNESTDYAIHFLQECLRDEFVNTPCSVGCLPLIRLGSTELNTYLTDILCGGKEAEQALEEMKPYLYSSLIRITFDSRKDLMSYCKSQDLSTIKAIDKLSIVQTCEDDSRIMQACEYGTVVRM